jgi:hypothetical protein
MIPDFKTFHRHTSPYVPVPFQDYVCDFFDDWALCRMPYDAMVFIPIQHTKSFLFADRGPAYLVGRDPLTHVGVFGYGEDIVTRAQRNNTRVIESDWYQKEFGWRIAKATASELVFDVPGQDGRWGIFSRAINGAIAGHSARFAIVDDPHKNRESVMSPSIRQTILDNYLGVIEPRSEKIFMVTTRWALNDLPGEIMRIARANPIARQWRVLTMAATNDEGRDSHIVDTATGQQTFLPPYDALVNFRG